MRPLTVNQVSRIWREEDLPRTVANKELRTRLKRNSGIQAKQSVFELTSRSEKERRRKGGKQVEKQEDNGAVDLQVLPKAEFFCRVMQG